MIKAGQDAQIVKEVFEGRQASPEFCPLNERESNAKKMIDAIEANLKNGNDLSRMLFSYSKIFIKNYADREDILQDLFLNMIRRKAIHYDFMIDSSADIIKDKKFIHFIYACMKNLCIDSLKSKSSRRELKYMGFDSENKNIFNNKTYSKKNSDYPEKEAIRNETMNTLLRNLENMGKDYGELLSLYVSGLKYRELATRFNVPIGTIKSRLNNARRRFSNLQEIVALAV